MTLTEDQRIAIIKHAVQASKGLGLKTKALEDFISEIKSEEVWVSMVYSTLKITTSKTKCL